MYHSQNPKNQQSSFLLPRPISTDPTTPTFYHGQSYAPYQEDYQWTEDTFNISSWDQHPFSMPQNCVQQHSPALSNHASSYHQGINPNKNQPRNKSIIDDDAALNHQIQKKIKRALAHLAEQREERLIQARKKASILYALGGATRNLYLINLKIQEQNKKQNKARAKAYQAREAEVITHHTRETIMAKYSHLPRIHCDS